MVRIIKKTDKFEVVEILDLGCRRNRQLVIEKVAIHVKIKDITIKTKIRYEAD